jgi:protein-tyrosine kinase
MEGLEAAMAKARAARTELRLGGGRAAAPRGAPDPATANPATRLPAHLPDGLWDWSSLPAFEIPVKQARSMRLGAAMGTDFASYYGILRARVLRQMKEKGWTRLAVTSPRQKSGKSTISLNLALSLARSDDCRVILMDFDLRRPSLARLLDIKTPPNMTGLLRPGAFFKDFAVRYGSNLAICTNRAKVANSAELLQGYSVKDALDRIEGDWQPDVMIFDTPPMQGNDDNMGFFAHVDCALIVAAAGSDSLAEIDRCEAEVAGLTNVLGTVLNKCRYTDSARGEAQDYY